jgi:hypothetical protein
LSGRVGVLTRERERERERESSVREKIILVLYPDQSRYVIKKSNQSYIVRLLTDPIFLDCIPDPLAFSITMYLPGAARSYLV